MPQEKDSFHLCITVQESEFIKYRNRVKIKRLKKVFLLSFVTVAYLFEVIKIITA